MANMRHKSVEARRVRNGRYKAAINPIRKAFNCTAAEAGPLIIKELHRNNAIQSDLDSIKAILKEEKAANVKLRSEVERLNKQLLAGK